MKITFVEPTRYLPDGRLLKSRHLLFPALTFPLLAALTPNDIEISVRQEWREDIDFNRPTDLVGLTALSGNVLRAYEIADRFRARGVPVVMGGCHVSMEPEEALEHADAVFVGEADRTWPRFLADFRSGRFRRLYADEDPPPLDHLPPPRFSVLDLDRYLVCRRDGLWRFPPRALPVQTARGCPQTCGFCSVTRFHRGAYRPRPIPSVIEEIRALKVRTVGFVDDNIFAQPERAKDLFRALAPLRIRWFGQATMGAADDPEILSLARSSGCLMLSVGLETLSDRNLTQLAKTGVNRSSRYARQLTAYRKAGIDVNINLMFGLDDDAPDVFRRTGEFLGANGIVNAFWEPVRPTPGTPLYEQFKREGRLKHERWWRDRRLSGDIWGLVFTPARIDDRRFGEDLFRSFRRFYSPGAVLKRTLWPPQRRIPRKLAMALAARRKTTPEAFAFER